MLKKNGATAILMKQKESKTSVTPETCAELDSVSGACGTNYQVSRPTNIGEIADKISVSLRFFGDDGKGYKISLFVF